MGVRLGPGWQSPAVMPRRWLAGLFGVSAIFASLVAIFSSDQVHQLWGAMAACGYGLAVAAGLGWGKGAGAARGRGRGAVRVDADPPGQPLRGRRVARDHSYPERLQPVPAGHD